MPGRVAVLGARGFAGRAITARLQSDGWRVRAVGRTISGFPALDGDVQCDARRPGELVRAVDDCDVVVNAVTGGAETDVPIASVLRDALRGGRIGQAIQISSLSVYGAPPSRVNEDCEPTPASGHAYAFAKLQAERILLECSGSTILRPGCLYGIGGRQWVERLARLLQMGRLGLLGELGEGSCLLLHVQDLAAAVSQAAQRAAGAGRVNILAPERLTWNQYFVRLAASLGLPPLQRMSRGEVLAEVWFAAPIIHAAQRVIGRQSDVLTPATLRLFSTRADIVSNRPALVRAADYTPLDAGLAEAVKHFRLRQPPPPIHAIRRAAAA